MDRMLTVGRVRDHTPVRISALDFRMSKGLPEEYFATRSYAHGKGDPQEDKARPNV
jgi:hypothetical protein